MSNLDLSQAMVAARKAAQAGSEVLLEYYGNLSQVSEKEQAGLVSEADKESERVIKQVLFAEFAGVDFLGEEEAFGTDAHNIGTDATTWVVDPLDGTTNYVHRFPIFCVSIGLLEKGEMSLALIDVPMLNRTYTAIKGKGAFCNEKPIKVSCRKTLSESLLATGFFTSNIRALEEQLQIFSRVVSEGPRGIRRSGSAAYDLCLVAEGVFDGFWERNLSPWDTCAGALLVNEAGGRVTNYHGNEFHPSMKSLIASTPDMYDCVSKLVKESVYLSE